MKINYEAFALSTYALATQHKASGLAEHQYIDDRGLFADYPLESLLEARESVLNLRNDIFMHNEANLVRFALKELTELDYSLITFFHGSAMSLYENFLDVTGELLKLYPKKIRLNQYLTSREDLTLQELMGEAKSLADEAELDDFDEVIAIYDELWLSYMMR